MIMPAPYEKKYTVEEFYSMDLPECCELINGDIYIGESGEKYIPSEGDVVDMAPAPSYFHQEISGRLHTAIQNYIDKNKGKCKIYTSPADVKLGDRIVQPDIFVTCDTDKIDGRFCNGAPDWVIEILSPCSIKLDTYEKMCLYRESGVREYWIADPMARRLIIYPFEENTNPEIYTFESEVTAHIYKDNSEPFKIRLADYF